MTDLKILKVKLIKNGEKVLIAYEKSGDMKSDGGETFKERAHVDLTNAVNALSCHLAILTGYITEKKSRDREELEKFVVTGYSIGGGEDEEGVVITGYRITPNGKTVTLNTPFLRLDADPSEYYLIADLNECIEKIDFESREYMGGKIAPKEQLELEMPDENITKMTIAHPDDQNTDEDNNAQLIIEASNERSKARKARKTKEEPIHFPEE